MSSAGNIFLLFSSMTTTTSTRNTFISALKVVEKLCDKSRAIVRKSTRLPTHTCVPTIGRWTGVRLEDHHQLTIHSFVLGQPDFSCVKISFCFPSFTTEKKEKRRKKSSRNMTTRICTVSMTLAAVVFFFSTHFSFSG